jgi:hypothetical protein
VVRIADEHLRQNGVGTGFVMADAILPKMFIRDAHHQE